MATRRIYLIRHGEYDWDNQPDPMKGLTVRGVRQARLTARRLRSIPATAIHSSDLMRALETATIIGAEHEGVPFEKSPDLRECFLPSPTFSNVPQELIEAGEQQAANVFSKYLRPADARDEHDIIVSHGNLIRYLAGRVLRSSESWLRMRTFNCGITEIEIESDGRLWLASYNDVGHLPHKLITAGVPNRSGKVQSAG